MDEAIARVAAFLASRREELRPGLDVGHAAFLVMETLRGVIEVAVRHRDGLVQDPRFVSEVTALVVRYLCPDVAGVPAR